MVQPNTDNIVLQAKGIRKSFGGIKALDGVNLKVYQGRVNAIVGENGAGKSTLMKILTGIYQDYDGQIVLDGRKVAFVNPKDAQNNGIAIIHQELNLIPYLSVAENVFLGREFTNRLGLIDYKQMYSETTELLQRLDLNINPRIKVSNLRIGQIPPGKIFTPLGNASFHRCYLPPSISHLQSVSHQMVKSLKSQDRGYPSTSSGLGKLLPQ